MRIRTRCWKGATSVNLYDELTALIDALNAARAGYALCGGLAVALHGHPRATQDVDLLVPEAHLEDIKAALAPLGFTVPALPMTFDPGTASERRVHRISKVAGDETLTVDLVLVGSAFGRAWETRESLDWRGRRLVAVSREGLAQMKRLAGRAQDLADLDALELAHE